MTTPADRMLKAVAELWPTTGPGSYGLMIEGRLAAILAIDNYGAPDDLYLAEIGVIPQFRGMGHGRAILETVCHLADRHGVDLYLSALSTGPMSETDLTGWYARHGFETTEPFPEMEGQAMHRPFMTEPLPTP